MKTPALICILLFCNSILAQDKLITQNAKVQFEASVPFFEEIKAVNENVQLVLDLDDGQIDCKMLIKQFQFKRDLMKQHFNDNYLESDDYPKAYFEGKIQNFDPSILSDVDKEYRLNGKMEIHGETKDMMIIVKIKKMSRTIELNAAFKINTDDYKIQIPWVVSNKISKTVLTSIQCSFPITPKIAGLR